MIQRLVHNLSSSSGVNPSLRANMQRSDPVQGATGRISSSSKIKKTETQTADIRGRAKREQDKKELTANTSYVSNTSKASYGQGARESHSVKGREPQSRMALTGVSGGVGRVRAEQIDKFVSNDRDESVLEYSDSDSDERVTRSAHTDSACNASHFSGRVSNGENMCRREDDEYEDDFENCSSGEDPEPAKHPPPAYQLQRLDIVDTRNSVQDQGKGQMYRHPSNDDIGVSAMARGALNGAEVYFRGDQSVPIDKVRDRDRDRKHSGGYDEESSPTEPKGRGDTAKTSSNAPQAKSVSEKCIRISPALTGSSSTGNAIGRGEVPQRGVSARGQPKGLSRPQSQSQYPLQQRQRGEESKETFGGRTGPSNGSGERNSNARATPALISSTAISEQRARLELRAAERRERVLFLHKQAEERVLSKLRDTEQQIKYVLHNQCSVLCFIVTAICCIVLYIE